MRFERSSGVLLHPSSLPGGHGIGDLGPAAREWIDFLSETGCGLWQVLPLGPTGFRDSPYQSLSGFGGNPALVSPELLVADGLLRPEEIQAPGFPDDRVDFGRVLPWKAALLDRAFERFEQSPPAGLAAEFAAFQDAQAGWLEELALFMALKEVVGGGGWNSWPEPLRRRTPEALEQARREQAAGIRRQAFRQFLFFRQWEGLRRHAAAARVRIIGDLPIFSAYDSADVWSRPDLYRLDGEGRPTAVAGVPPDYFSPTGQLWGNPLYRWENHAKDGYAWWVERLRWALRLADLVRLDHFRGFAAYWEVPAGETTAEKGRWIPGPGEEFLLAVRQRLGDLPFIAEDLGQITPDVIALREHFGLPGMKVLQFAFSGPDNPFLPHRHSRNAVVYTGTHDNDTSRGWFESIPEGERDFCRRYLGREGRDIAWDLIRAAWSSPAVFALAPVQDLLDLDSAARMNHPGRTDRAWSWRMPAGALTGALRARLREMNRLYQRSARPEAAGPVPG